MFLSCLQINAMKKYLILGMAMMVFSCSKKQSATTTQPTAVEKETIFVEKPVENINPENEPSQSSTPQGTSLDSKNEDSGLKDLSGKHPLTLQWISWDKPGIINFKKTAENEYQVSGSQKRGSDYLKIEGKVIQISGKELAFEGTVETNIKSNGGKCLRTGPQTFLATQNRKYWRMQNMVECFGLTDYVDIYF